MIDLNSKMKWNFFDIVVTAAAIISTFIPKVHIYWPSKSTYSLSKPMYTRSITKHYQTNPKLKV